MERARRLRAETTYSERLLWAELKKLKLNIRRQAPIGRYIADFAQHSASLVIEVDGGWHDSDNARLHDHERDTWLRSLGYEVLRLKDADVLRDAAGLAAQVADVITAKRGKTV